MCEWEQTRGYITESLESEDDICILTPMVLKQDVSAQSHQLLSL